MTPVTLIGPGRVGGHLLQAFYASGVTIHQVFTRKRGAMPAEYGIPENVIVHDWNGLERHDGLFILSVPDQAIGEVAGMLARQIGDRGLVVHTSGTTGQEVLRTHFSRNGWFYPLQSFSAGTTVDWHELPIFIQADGADDEKLLARISDQIGARTVRIREEQRPYLHLAAVIAHNFSNGLFRWAKDTLEDQGMSFEHLHALIRDGLEKSLQLGPDKAQTGPAQRGDIATIQQHLDILKDLPEKRTLYRTMSLLINPKLDLPE